MRKNIYLALLAIVLVIFIGVGATSVRSNNQKLQLHEIELKSKETKLIELNQKYDEVIQLKTETDQQKEEQLKKIQELETERQRLERELQAKLDRNKAEQEKLATAAKKATGTATASAATPQGCDAVRSIMSSKGFSGAELEAAVKLSQLESGCRSNNNNPSSNACNFFQEWPCGKWGGNHNTEAHINGAIGYMQASYGSWQNALYKWHSRSPHWW